MSKFTPPRIGKNKSFIGPEYAGCSGTGQRPKIVHCGYSKRYIVGTEYHVDALRAKIIHSPNKRKFELDGKAVWAFKSRKPAAAMFVELCEAVATYNANVRAERAKLQAKAAAGDIGAALALGDL